MQAAFLSPEYFKYHFHYSSLRLIAPCMMQKPAAKSDPLSDLPLDCDSKVNVFSYRSTHPAEPRQCGDFPQRSTSTKQYHFDIFPALQKLNGRIRPLRRQVNLQHRQL